MPLRGVAGDGFLAEDAAFNPITVYGESKVRVEADLATLADDGFSPTYMQRRRVPPWTWTPCDGTCGGI